MEKLNQVTNILNSISSANNKISNNQLLQNKENTLERIPAQDTVSFSGKLSEEELNDEMNIEVSNGFLGAGKRKIHGKILNKRVDLKLDTGLLNLKKVKLSGTIEGTPVDLEMKDYKLSGNISNEHKDILPYIKKLMIDKRNDDIAETVVVVG